MRRYWLAAVALFAFAAFVAATGGVKGSIGGIPYSARRVVPLCLVAWAIILLGARSADSAQLDRQIAGVREAVRRRAVGIAIGLAAATFLIAVVFGAFTAAGADPYGYVSQAELWARGNPVQFQSVLAMDAPWPNAARSFCPLGYRSSIVPGLIVPTYAAGLPLQMAALARAFGARAVYFVVPLAGALTVWLTFRLARRMGASPEASLVSAFLVALSPVFMFQLMQPMSDVPVTAWWLLSIVAASAGSPAGALGAGAAASVAILTRPNLVPLVLPVAGFIAFGHDVRVRAKIARLLAFGLALVPGVWIAAAINTLFFGSPLSSGYGSLSDLYARPFARDNLVRYPTWLWQTQSPYIFLAFAAPFVPRFRIRSIQALAFTVVLVGCYLFYYAFDHWTYLRFLLPAIPLLILLATMLVDAATAARSARLHAAALAMIASVIGLSYLHSSVRGDVFRLEELFHDRYRVSAETAAAKTPPNAVVFAVLQSGSLRYYGDRLTVRYDFIYPDWLERAMRYLRDKGRAPYLALETGEIDEYAKRFREAGPPLLDAPSQPLEPLGLVTLFGPATAQRPTTATSQIDQ